MGLCFYSKKGEKFVGQLSIYDELGFGEDPIFCLLLDLSEDTTVLIGSYTIGKNALGWYEISSCDIHECSKTIENCYKKLNYYLSPIETRAKVDIHD